MDAKEQQADLIKTARMAGIWYLALAITGVLGFLVFHPQLYISGDPEQTLKNLAEKESFARVRLLLEIGVVGSQAMAALWFYKLFRNINPVAALATGLWGTVNAVVILISAISMGVAIKIANGTLLTLDFKVASIHLLEQFSSNAWGVGGLFFGLWLIPMGYTITSSQRMPIWLGRLLILGGIGYILNTLIGYSGISSIWVNMLTIPATIGEFWMIGYLLVFGMRPSK
ncbi:DUF4386 domain-containing protein [Aquiflexum lacus]|uniref:DUF4386 domain-containing protein n=1 Tax=Aquiflexum lacus TaxID=2483805 RepID=UPI001895BD58|nr:DUF4386 domain-containing protein [Aquiflexum lacus]